MSRIYSTNYPPEDELVEMMKELRTYKAVAAQLGLARESLKDYLKRRPELKARMDAHRPPLLSTEERASRNREAGRRYKARMQRDNPEHVRALNRKWAKNQSPEKRAQWNHYNRIRRLTDGEQRSAIPEHLYEDPCAYCGEEGGTTDHIIPINNGGSSDEDNLTAACLSCNAAKGDRFSLLGFLLYRRA